MISRALLFLTLIGALGADIIPADRRIDWSAAGVTGGIPTRNTIGYQLVNGDGTGHTIDPNGVVDARAEILFGITQCTTGQVLQFPAAGGTYALSAAVGVVQKSITIRGATNANGVPITTVVGANTGGGTSCFDFGTSFQLLPANVVAINSGYTKDSTTIVTQGNTGLVAGRMCIIDQLNDGTLVQMYGGEGPAGFCSRSNWTTVTISIASPAVVNWPNHRMQHGISLSFTTTGTLPTGITANTTYQVRDVIDADNFTIQAFQSTGGGGIVPTGPAINTSGTQSGTHTGAAPGMRGMQQMAHMNSVTSNGDGTYTVVLDTPMMYTYSSSLAPQIIGYGTQTTSLLGLENIICVDNGGSTSSSDRGIINLNNCEQCWLYNVWTQNCFTEHVYTNHILHCTFQKCYLTGAKPNTYTQNHAYGFRLALASTENLITDDILGVLRGSCILEYGSAGNVVSYCYGLPGRNDAATATNAMPPVYQPSHGAHPMMNLFEGNRGPRFQSDWIWGTSSHNTVFRCALTGVGLNPAIVPPAPPTNFSQLQTAMDAEAGSTYFNWVGNVVGDPTGMGGNDFYQIAAANPPLPTFYNYTGSKLCFRYGFVGDNATSAGGNPTSYSTILQTGNWDYKNNSIIWDGSGVQALPNSLYLAGKPTFFGGLAWPNVDPTTTPSPTVTENAAQFRFENGFVDPPSTPAAPTGLTPTLLWITAINLAWTDNATNETNYFVERSPDGVTWAQVASLPANSNSYSDTGLTPGTLYYYRVRCFVDPFYSGYSNTISGTTLSSLPATGGNSPIFNPL